MLEYPVDEERRPYQQLARDFARREIRPVAAALDRNPDVRTNFPWDVVKKAYKVGLHSLGVPLEYGGAGADLLTQVVVIDELAYEDVSCSKILAQNWKIAEILAGAGTKEQASKYIAQYLADDTYMMAASQTEPDYGSDGLLPYDDSEAGPKLSAVEDEDYYVLNGTKQWAANGAVAKLYLITGRVNKRVGGSQGSSYFIVPRDTPGFSIGTVWDKIGWRAYNNAQQVLEDVRVPKENLLGEKHGIDHVQKVTAGRGNIEVAAHTLAIARAAFDAALAYAKERVQGGVPIIQHQVISTMIADMFMELKACRTLLWQAAWQATYGQMDPLMALSCKVLSSETSVKVCKQAMEIFGGMGAMKEVPVEKYLRDALISLHINGTNQINRLKLGARIAALS